MSLFCASAQRIWHCFTERQRPSRQRSRSIVMDTIFFGRITGDEKGSRQTGYQFRVIPSRALPGRGGIGGRNDPSRGVYLPGTCRRPSGDRHLSGRFIRLLGVHRHFRAAHRHLRAAGRGRTQGLSARGRAHQQRTRTDQEDIAEDHQGRARQGSETTALPIPAPSRTKRCRPSSALSPRTRRC